MTERLARASAAHPWRTILAWVVGVVAAVVAAGAFLGDLTTEGRVTNDPESERADAILLERTTLDERLREWYSDFIVVENEGLDAAALDATVAELARSEGIDAADDPVRSRDGRAVLIPIRLADPGDENIERVLAAVERADARDGLAVDVTGEFTFDRDFSHLSEKDLREGELFFGAPAAMIVLVLVFGALVAAVLPLVLALVSIAVALGLTGLLASQFELAIYVTNMLAGMGLALGIDYALFVISRFREERAVGKEKIDAIAASGATASRAVLFSGFAFVVAMMGMLLVPNTIMRSLAAGAILVGIVSVIAALTLLPALLGLFGDRVNALHVPVLGRRIAAQSGAEGRFWGAIVRVVMRRPLVSLAAAAAFLLLAASPILGMHTGAAGVTTLPDELPSKQGFVALRELFPEAGQEQVQIVVDGDVAAPPVRAAIERLAADVEREEMFGPAEIQTRPQRNIALVAAPVLGDAVGDEAFDAVRKLRGELIPAAFEDLPAEALVTGTTAANLDYVDVMDAWLAPVLVFVLGLSFLLLTVAFRSIVVAATAIVLNLLSVGAAYGLLVLVFQEGVGNELLGLAQVDIIEAWVPLFLFAVLFGLSMDYQVFLLSRIRERFARTGDTNGAIAFGITTTARIITGAALIIVAVFWGFAMGDLVMFQQMGFGIAVALLIDATIVRSVLVPAAMRLLGQWNWYLPRWLEWLPHVEVEREHAPGAQPAPARGR